MDAKSIVNFKPVRFLVEVREELSKIIWPSRKETIKMTAIVVVVSIVIGSFIGALDFTFTKLTGLLIKK